MKTLLYLILINVIGLLFSITAIVINGDKTQLWVGIIATIMNGGCLLFNLYRLKCLR